jgi:DNA-binding response OmpR family regulator
MSVAPSLDVLVVEDDPALSELLVRSLHAARFTTDVAGDVAEAKRLLSRGGYAVLVLDLMLPDGMGFDVLDFIKVGELPPLNIIVITAADRSLLTRLDRSMVKTVMFKPIALDHFVATVRALAFASSKRPV